MSSAGCAKHRFFAPVIITEVAVVQVFVENGLAGCALAMARGAVTVVVDALRASAMLASLFHYGTERVLVVKEVSEAFAQRQRWPAALLAGERGGPKVPGFDLGNSPLQGPPELDIRSIIFSSSNCSRCCVGVGQLPVAFLGTTVNAAATARTILAAQQAREPEEVVLVTAGSAENEALLTIEDHVAAGAIMAACAAAGADVRPANDRARVCQLLYGEGDQGTLTAAFRQSQNGQRLTGLGLGADVEFASRLDVFDVVPRIAELVPLVDGGQGAVLVRA